MTCCSSFQRNLDHKVGERSARGDQPLMRNTGGNMRDISLLQVFAGALLYCRPSYLTGSGRHGIRDATSRDQYGSALKHNKHVRCLLMQLTFSVFVAIGKDGGAIQMLLDRAGFRIP